MAMDSPPPKRWHTREDSGIRLDREGRWWHDGEPVEHPKIIEAFNMGLCPSVDGRFVLRFGNDWCFVEIEDAAYRVLSADLRGEEIQLGLSDRQTEVLSPETLTLEGGVLHCRVKEGRAKARFTRDAQFALGTLIETTAEGSFLALGGRTWMIRDVAATAG
jgi:hypothetical protein